MSDNNRWEASARDILRHSTGHNTKSIQIVSRAHGVHHLDSTARKPKGQWPERRRKGEVSEVHQLSHHPRQSVEGLVPSVSRCGCGYMGMEARHIKGNPLIRLKKEKKNIKTHVIIPVVTHCKKKEAQQYHVAL